MQPEETEKRLSRLETESAIQKNERQHSNADLEEIKDCLDRIESKLLGNGSIGITTRIDRLEQNERRREESEKRRAKASWLLIVAVAGLALKALAAAFGWIV